VKLHNDQRGIIGIALLVLIAIVLFSLLLGSSAMMIPTP